MLRASLVVTTKMRHSFVVSSRISFWRRFREKVCFTIRDPAPSVRSRLQDLQTHMHWCKSFWVKYWKISRRISGATFCIASVEWAIPPPLAPCPGHSAKFGQLCAPYQPFGGLHWTHFPWSKLHFRTSENDFAQRSRQNSCGSGFCTFVIDATQCRQICAPRVTATRQTGSRTRTPITSTRTWRITIEKDILPSSC